MERTPREIWKKRIERWQASELTAKEFAAEIGVKPGTLSHWKWQLGWEARGKPRKKQTKTARRKSPKGSPRRVARKGVHFAEVLLAPSPLSPIELVLKDGVQVRVSDGFEEATLRRVLAVVRDAT